MVVGENGAPPARASKRATFSKIRTIADFYFVPEQA